ncbi:MAG: hypothetical protein ACXU86_12620, partial [Archangium sp.]
QELQHQQQQSRIQSLEQQQATKDARARQLEQLRQQRLTSLQRGYDWIVTADQLLERGDFTVGPAIAYARREISNAIANTSETGRGEITGYLQSALNRLFLVDPMVERRDSYPARLQLQAAGSELNLAWQISLQRSGSTLVNQ